MVGYVPSNKLSKTKSRPHGVVFPLMLGVRYHKIFVITLSLVMTALQRGAGSCSRKLVTPECLPGWDYNTTG